MAHVRILPPLLLLCAIAGMARAAPETARNADQNMKSIDQVFQEQRDRIMAFPGVVGTGIGLCGDRPCIKVYTSQPASALAGKLPGFLDGYVIEIEMTGPIRALPGGQ